jgi:hypothetical protein
LLAAGFLAGGSRQEKASVHNGKKPISLYRTRAYLKLKNNLIKIGSWEPSKNLGSILEAG